MNAKQLDDRSLQVIAPIAHTREDVHKALIEHNQDIKLEVFTSFKPGLVSKAYVDSAWLVSCFPADKTPAYQRPDPMVSMIGDLLYSRILQLL